MADRVRIPHYYGDYVRNTFVAVAVFMLLAAPLYVDAFNEEFVYILGGVIALIMLAALTNPRSSAVMTLNACAAACGIIMYELWAVAALQAQSIIVFMLREVPVVLFIIALYFSLKTLRAMVLGNLGKEPRRADLFQSLGRLFPPMGGKDRDALGNPAMDDTDKLA